MTLATRRPQVSNLATVALVSALTMATVSSLYWPQALLMQIRSGLDAPNLVALLPGAILLGYAIGVTALAIASHNLVGRGGFVWHVAILVAGLGALAAAPNGITALMACTLLGAGCALTQRLLIIATNVYRPERRAEIIGLLVASGLSGIVVARAWVGDIAQHLGWRNILLMNAALIATIVAALLTRPWAKPAERVARPISIAELWNSYATVRHAALHQAVIFAIFNAGWAILPTLTDTMPATRAIVAGIGALTAVIAGRTARRLPPARLAKIAPVFIVVAAAMATLIATHTAYIAAMALVEVGTQLALVANQTRAQAIAPDLGSRGRVASLVTAIGFAGGAFGAAAANILTR